SGVVPAMFALKPLIYAGVGSLRQAVLDANAAGADTIQFDKGLTGTIRLASPLRLSDTADPTTIDGPGASLLTVSGNNLKRVFEIDSGVTVDIDGLTVSEGFVE